MNKISPKLKNLLSTKFDNFQKFILEIISEEQKVSFNEQIESLKNDFSKILLFVIFIKKENLNKNIDEFMQKFKINESNKPKIEEYYLFFLDIKNLILKNE